MQQRLTFSIRVQLTGLNITTGMAVTYGEHSGHITVRFVLNPLVCGDQHQRTSNRPAAQAAMTFLNNRLFMMFSGFQLELLPFVIPVHQERSDSTDDPATIAH